MRYGIEKGGFFLIANIIIWFSMNYGSPVLASDAVLTWNPNTESDLAGYKVYYGTASGSYGTPINVGNLTTYTVTGLGYGTYYFAVKAYDTTGNLSGYSIEINKTFSDTTPPVISAITAGSITGNSSVVTWSTNEAATSLVEFGTTTAYGSSTTLNSTLVTSHSAALSGLAASTLYHYRVKSADAAGNLGISGDNSFTTATAPDTTPPVISGIAAGSITSTGATISWITNEPSDTQIQYGTTTAYGTSTTLNTSLAISHNQSLTGLQPSTLFNFRVLSRDAAGNLATSGNNTFTTAAAPDTTPPVISGITASNMTISSAIVTWTTNEAATSLVEYGTTTAYGSSTTLNATLVTSHSTTLSGLTGSTPYHYRVKSTDASGNTANSGDNTFSTSATPDTTAPVLSNIAASNVAPNSVVITWTTDEAATSQAEYGTTTSYGSSSSLISTPLTSHSISISGLIPSTPYQYRVISKDAAGNTATSGNNTFTTPAASDTTGPVLSLIAAGNITATGATITWGTDESATTQVEYGLTNTYGDSTTLNATLLNSHSQTLFGLQSGTLYYFRVKSTDGAGNLSVSGDIVFTTAVGGDTTPPQNVQNFTAHVGDQQITLSWINPPDSDFVGVQIRYRTDHYPSNINDGDLLGDFTGQANEAVSTTHTSLQNGVTYYYSASSYDNSGNYQETAYTSATASSSATGSGSPNNVTMSGGCGMVRPGNDKPSGPAQAADMVGLLTVILIAILKRELQRKKIFDRMMQVSCIIKRLVYLQEQLNREEPSGIIPCIILSRPSLRQNTPVSRRLMSSC